MEIVPDRMSNKEQIEVSLEKKDNNESGEEEEKKIEVEEEDLDFVKQFSLSNEKKLMEKSTFTTNSLFIFNINSSFRRILIDIINSSIFTLILSSIVIINCICLLFTTFDGYDKFNNIADIVFTTIYTVEALMKIIAFGFYFGRNSYLRNPWNVFDFLVVITGILGIIIFTGPSFLVFRVFMLLRPLKSITYLSGLKALIKTLINSLVDLSSVFVLMMFFIVFFSTFALSLWSSTFDYKCRTTILPTNGLLVQNEIYKSQLCGGRTTCGNNTELCQSKNKYNNTRYFFFDPRSPYNENEAIQELNYGITTFSNFFESFFTIFQTSTLEGWYEIMYLMIGAGSPYSAIFFFYSLVFCVSLFVINLTIAVLLYNFEKYSIKAEMELYNEKLLEIKQITESKKKENIKVSMHKHKRFSSSDSRLREEDYFFKRIKPYHIKLNRSIFSKMAKSKITNFYQHTYRKSMCFKKLKLKTEYQKKYKIAEIFYTIYYQPIFQYFIHLCIILNCVNLAIEKYFSNNDFFANINYFIVIVFGIESMLNLIGLGLISFMKKLSNIWDFIIFVGSIIELFIREKDSVRWFSLIRVLRIFKLLRWWKSIQIILFGMLSAMIDMVNYLFLIGLVFYIYSLVGFNIYKNRLKFNAQTNIYDATAESNFINFDNFPNSLFSVFSIFIGYAWGDIYYACYRSSEIDNTYNFLFFFTMILLGNITMKNIFLAYLIQNYQIAANLMEKNVNTKKFVEHIYLFFGNKHLVENANYLQANEQTGSLTVFEEGYFYLVDRNDLNNNRVKRSLTNARIKQNQFNLDLKFNELNNQKSFEFNFYEFEDDEDSIHQLDTSIFYTLKKNKTHRLSPYHKNINPTVDEDDKSLRSINHKIENKSVRGFVDKTERRKGLFSYSKRIKSDLQEKKFWAKVKDYMKESSLFIFHKDWSIRIMIKNMISSKWFHNLIIVLIIVYTITCFFDNPYNSPETLTYKIVLYSDLFFTIVFAIEALLKIISNGFILLEEDEDKKMETKERDEEADNKASKYEKFLHKHKDSTHHNSHSVEGKRTIEKKIKLIEEVNKEEKLRNLPYLRNTENSIDFLIVVVSIVAIIASAHMDSSSYSNILGIRVLRSLRPIRILTRSETLKLLVKCVIKSIPPLFHISIVIGMFLYVYAIVGMNLFTNDSFYCSEFMTIKTSSECRAKGGKWINFTDDFSNFFTALRTLFILMTTEGWLDILKMQLNFSNGWYTYMYFISFVILGYMFILNLLVTILIDNFKDIKQKETGFSDLEGYEIDYVKVQKIMLKYKPKELLGKMLRHKNDKKINFHSIINSQYLDYFIITLLVINFLVVTTQSNNSSDAFNNFEFNLNRFLTLIFNIEILMKIVVFKRLFFKSGWNLFDFFIILLTDLNTITEWIWTNNQYHFGGYLNLIRFLKIINLLRMMAISNKIKAIFNTFIFILPTISTIGVLLAVLITMYASIGTNIFGTVPRRKVINEYNNMEDFFNSALLLFRTALGGQWNSIMEELSYHNCTFEEGQTDYYCVMYNIKCYENVKFEDLMNNRYSCGNNISYAFFLSFYFLCAIVIMNLFIVLVVEGYSDNMSENESLFSHDLMENFIRIWMKYDPKSTFYIKPHEFVLLLKELEPPLGLNHDRNVIDHSQLRYHNHQRFKLLCEVIDLSRKKQFSPINDPFLQFTESTNTYDFKGFYITKDRKFYTSLLEMFKVLKMFDFPIHSFDDDEENLRDTRGSIHFVNACIGLAHNFVLRKNTTVKKISNSVNNTFTKKLWTKKYRLDDNFIFYGESRKTNKLVYKMVIDVFKKNESQVKKYNEKKKVFDITFQSEELSENCMLNTNYLRKRNCVMDKFNGKDTSSIEPENSVLFNKRENFKVFRPNKTKIISFNFD